jgi:hypothetical protein
VIEMQDEPSITVGRSVGRSVGRFPRGTSFMIQLIACRVYLMSGLITII